MNMYSTQPTLLSASLSSIMVLKSVSYFLILKIDLNKNLRTPFIIMEFF